MSTLPLDQPLPAELTGRTHGWFTRYRRYPVFGKPWARGRLRSIGLVVGLFVALLVFTLLGAAPHDRPWPGVAELVVSLAVPLLAGPWLGERVRRRGWDTRREGLALTAVVAALVVAMSAFYVWGAEPMKQFVAERTGGVDEHGQRRRIAMTLGITVETPEGDRFPRTDAARELRDDPVIFAVNIAVRAGLAFLLAGGLALRGWRREQSGLAALAQERALAQAEAQRREAELKLSVLAAQVEPHFLFNTLAGVRSAIATDPARASEMIDHLVDYLRAAIPRLRGSASAQATVRAQFDIVRAYLGLMAARMPRLAFHVEAPPELLDARCPPLMLISLAENAVKHGVEPKIGPVRIAVTAARAEDGGLALTVEDDGVGFAAAQSGTGIGLTNIRERLAQLYGARAALLLKARPGGGVAATITLPLEHAR
jgi:signal transduction histidine kinase